MDGSAEERRLVNYLKEYGFAQMRAPASGSATERELPDVHAARDGGTDHWAIELKTDQDGRGYVSPEEVEDLIWYAEKFGADPKLGIRPGGDQTFFLRSPSECDRTRTGNYTIHEPDSYDAFDGIIVEDPDGGELHA